MENGIVYMKAEAGYYENGQRVMLATGLAFERQDASNLNKTSYIENCETSAIGRALGFIGLGSEKSIASAEEVSNAIATQEAIEQGAIPDPTKGAEMPHTPPADASMNKVPSVPPTGVKTPENPVLKYLAEQRDELRVARKISKAENNALWSKQIEVLTAKGIIENKALSTFTMEEAVQMVNYMYSLFDAHGTELKPYDGQTA